MTGDFTRATFRAANRYTKVRAQQGRATLDAEVNEQQDIAGHRHRTTGVDVIGATGAPYHDPATPRNFQVTLDANGRDLVIAPGRIYVGGLLCENDAARVTYLTQPDFPGAALPAAAGAYAVYLDVWERHIAAAEQLVDGYPQMREPALGGADTASRVRAIWQVKLAPVASQACGAFEPPPAPTGKLRATEVPGAAAATDCMVPASGGYRRLENQFYRVEIHDLAGRPTYKWSRDNASLSSRAKSSDQNAATLVVEDPGRDAVIGFASARYVELTDEVRVLTGQSGVLLEVDTVTDTSIRVKNPGNLSLALGPNAIVRRWDGIGRLRPNTPAELEDGVQIEFDGGTFVVGDHWSFAARTLTGKVEWPRTGTGEAIFEARHGTAHAYAPLAVVSFLGRDTFEPTVVDCRALFPPLTAIKASDVSYDPARCSNLQGVDTVQEAIDRLCRSTGGEDPGIHVKGVFLASGDALRNDTFVPPVDLARGIRIDCDERLFEGSVVNKNGMPNPVCQLTLDVPWPLRGDERQFWGIDAATIVGFQPIVLAAEVVAAENAIRWTPLGPTQNWLVNRLLPMITEMTNDQAPRVRARLELAGNFIWGPEAEPRLYLDGEAFGTPGRSNVDVILPSGNGRRGGTFALWFWLQTPVRRVPGIGFVPGRASRFFAVQAGAPPIGLQAVRLGIDRSPADFRALLPAGYEIDTSQAFNPAEAAALARRTNVQVLNTIISDKFQRPGEALVAQLNRVFRIPVQASFMTEAQILERIRASMGGTDAPDMVFVDEAMAGRLQTLGYSTDFVRI